MEECVIMFLVIRCKGNRLCSGMGVTLPIMLGNVQGEHLRVSFAMHPTWWAQGQDHSMTLRSAIYGIYYIPIFYKTIWLHFNNKRWKVLKVRKSRTGLSKEGGNIYLLKLRRGILPLLFEVAAFYFIISRL